MKDGEARVRKAQGRAAADAEQIDATDAVILDALERDGRATLSDLSEISKLSVSAVQSRVQKLERRGVIMRYRAVIDDERRGLPIRAFVSVTPLDYSQESTIPERLETLDGVMSCHSVAGAPSFVLVVRVASPAALEELLNLIHRTVPVNTETTMILKTYFGK
ncbi:MAG: Lrp/AsnC family transcriptional regulator [Bifidobacterium mongoliense]|jgi:Lrp/AsnC family leucine-responsive transcriptional regulator|uniref:AsnC-type transcriptional regulator n=1 Tax=Bifidobacterium mongoliense DSM 21395 TaxID=1437603 RepID=A0A087C060_9BIFI|nr:Lrp/AsnC family transcriptional regulator [Bifidobacterium mongoliense]KFI76660.1 AsnC-type transcriptional regulator [Bifidobacterium mongoliense DSM 21395]MDN5632986.1 Lrp/AsnC family transcriptional regulator [Bifidobacterium mongoliense]MDN5979663.1 Lrp/AsnC family transcriptional regulator [Bifidobacterium mongoliense]MDN6024799.1 Lrp/AsnC family transcriptional regulator [Bifidobacterium mongoliense]MDN6050814.1 Lrp/AsnC family transcriptional regulator [Bifidobacterium mongoliense]